MMLKKHEQGTPIPFGPFLAGAGWIAFFWGQQISDAYLNYSGL
jgi:leader peptidase (prepilin peptidase)/N-methyltransferase